ncbi:MAG: hypothetical protein INR70_17665 [Parafilimonas terrae]|nr:hypothetical protein [Parafilimonas terrae]
MVRLSLLATTLLALAGPALAQPKTDPDWPCVQRKVATLSPGQFWTGPDLGAASAEWGNDNEAAALAQKIASRRTELQEIDGLLDGYVGKLPDKAAREQGLARVYAAQKIASRRTELQEIDGLLDGYVGKLPDKAAREQGLARVYAGVFEVINGERNKIMHGIARYAQGQRRMAERIREEADQISQTKDAPSAADARELPKEQSELETKFAWDRRIFQERSQSLTYVCEVPTLLEQRLGEIARKIQAKL